MLNCHGITEFQELEEQPQVHHVRICVSNSLVAGTVITINIQRQKRLSKASLAGGERGTRGQILGVEAEFRHRGDLQPPVPWVSLLPPMCQLHPEVPILVLRVRHCQNSHLFCSRSKIYQLYFDIFDF